MLMSQIVGCNLQHMLGFRNTTNRNSMSPLLILFQLSPQRTTNHWINYKFYKKLTKISFVYLVMGASEGLDINSLQAKLRKQIQVKKKKKKKIACWDKSNQIKVLCRWVSPDFLGFEGWMIIGDLEPDGPWPSSWAWRRRPPLRGGGGPAELRPPPRPRCPPSSTTGRATEIESGGEIYWDQSQEIRV